MQIFKRQDLEQMNRGGGGERERATTKKAVLIPFSAPFALERTWLISWLREAISLRSSSFSVITDWEKKIKNKDWEK